MDFKIYNYAEFCSVVTKYTAQDGKTFLSAGKGDMMVWASKDGKYGFVKASFGKANLPGEEGEKARKMTIRLDRKVSASDMNRSLDFSSVSFRDSFDIVPKQIFLRFRQRRERRTWSDSLMRILSAMLIWLLSIIRRRLWRHCRKMDCLRRSI